MELMTPNETAKYIRMTPAALSVFRSRGHGGPTYVKLGGRYFYRKADVDAWLEANTHPQPLEKPEPSRITRTIKALKGRRVGR